MHRRCIALVLLLLAPTAHAHEFWLQPGSHGVAAGAAIPVRLMHGERFQGDVVPRNAPYVRRFEIVSDEATSPVLGRHGVGMSVTRVSETGWASVVYESREVSNELDAQAFEAYLAEERLEHIIERRAKLGESERPGREVYVRCAKSVVRVGDAEGPTRDRVVGLPVEIVIDPSTERTGAMVLWEGEPLTGARVVAVAQADPETLIELRTDAEGRVWLSEGAAGVWMLTTLHMERTDDRDDTDWKSYWASTTFELP